MKNNNFALLPWLLMAKHKYLLNFDLFFCDPTPFFGLLDCDYTHDP